MELRIDISEPQKSNFKQQLLFDFHNQFAENQRTREQSFLKILAFYAAPLTGYIFVYNQYFNTNEISKTDFYFAHLFAIFLLFVGVIIITTFAKAFRRDQKLVSKIRQICDIEGDDRVFPQSFNPNKRIQKSRFLQWLPDFYIVFYLLFVGIQILLISLVSIKLIWVGLSNQIDLFVTFIMTFCFGLTILSSITPYVVGLYLRKEF